jgi:uncharacterized protein (TIGR02452 family)
MTKQIWLNTAAMLNRNERAKLAKQTMSKTIPDLLKHNTKASNGVRNTELLRFNAHHDTPARRKSSVSQPTSGDAAAGPSTSTPVPESPKVIVKVVKSDTFEAAHAVQAAIPHVLIHKTKVCVLNMASALHPGGGVLNGSLAQEESLCMRSTLFASLNPDWYRLPDLACVYTPNVLVFRDTDFKPLKPVDQFYVDVISVAALKNPDLTKIEKEGKEEEVYGSTKDKEMMVAKIRGLFDVAKSKGVTHLVLGALGCGAYHNPPKEVARMFKRVIDGDRKHAAVQGITDITFAIFDEGANLEAFRAAFPNPEESKEKEEIQAEEEMAKKEVALEEEDEEDEE